MSRQLSFIKLWLILIPLTLTQCLSGSKKGDPRKDADGENVWVGGRDNSHPSYSPKGDTLLFVSARPEHNKHQVYMKDLASGEERRLTYQNGNVSSPHFDPEQKRIVYASDTDELKENPPLLYQNDEKSILPKFYQQPTEIYLHSVSGLEITRVTKRRGFDGEPRFSHDGRYIYWTRALKDRTQIMRYDRRTGQTITMRGLSDNPSQYVHRKDRKLEAWVGWNDDFTRAEIWIKKGKIKYEIPTGVSTIKTDLILSPDETFLIWAQNGPTGGPFELWFYDLETECARRLDLPGSVSRRHPTLSPDMKWLIYTVVRSGGSRIVGTPFRKPTGPCPTAS